MSRLGLLCELSNGERFLVDKDHFEIGRGRGSDLWIPDGTVARRHVLIQRQDGRWLISDLGSASGTWVDGRRIAAPTELPVGAFVEFAEEKVSVLALDYEARPGELLPGLDRQIRFTCPQLTCRAALSLSSRTSNAELEAAIGNLLIATGGALDGDTLAFTEPIELVSALQRMHERLEEQSKRLAGIEVRTRDHDLVIGSEALELLLEPTIPALAAWRWVMRVERVPVPLSLLRGIARDVERAAFRPLREELFGALDVEGAGLAAWLTRNGEGYLLWIGRDAGSGKVLVRDGHEDLRVMIEYQPTGWVGQVSPLAPRSPVRYQRLAAGDTIQIGQVGELVIVAIR